ncbi:MAG: thiamine phosphate synthase, partial [Proteobacteria bacterium]|nr:thiamine phosphate synthase [Pseudomonadota bacterium]
PTATKSGLSTFLGEEAITDFSAASDLPFTVMGGIKLEHIPRLTALGASRIAVVTALTQAENITEETGRWIAAINQGKDSGRKQK